MVDVLLPSDVAFAEFLAGVDPARVAREHPRPLNERELARRDWLAQVARVEAEVARDRARARARARAAEPRFTPAQLRIAREVLARQQSAPSTEGVRR